MTTIEVIILVLAALAGLIAYQAKHNGTTIAAQAKTDVTAAKTEATALAHDLELRIVALETKVGLVKAPVVVTPVAPAPAGPPAIATA